MKANSGLVVMLANADETYWPIQPSEGKDGAYRSLWSRAAMVPESDGYCLVAPDSPSSIRQRSNACRMPEDVITIPRWTGQLCHDLLADESAWMRFLAICREHQPVRIVPQVFSPAVETLIETLVELEIDVRTDHLPRVSGHTVRYWNTKIGGRDLLQSITEVRNALPAAVIRTNLEEVQAFIASETGRGLVVKATSSSAGSGVWLLPDTQRDDDILALLRRQGAGANPTAKIKTPSNTMGPYLIEEMIGLPTQNLSPTADFWIHADGNTEFIGIGVQLLTGAVAYRGCSSMPAGTEETQERCITLGRAVCLALSARGYRGPVNQDFIVNQSGQVSIAEMNLRQSAPLDQFLFMRRLFGLDWPTQRAFCCEEDVVFSQPVAATTVDELSSLLHSFAWLRAGELLYPLAVSSLAQPGDAQVSLLAVAATSPRAAEILARARGLLS